MGDRRYYRDIDGELWLPPGTVAELMFCNPKTVSRWAKAGRLGAARSPGGHRRFSLAEVNDLRVRNGLPAVTPDQVTGDA